MSSASDNPTPSEPRRLSIRLPQPVWIGVAAVVLMVIAVGLDIGLPIYRQQRALAAIREATERRPLHYGVVFEANDYGVTFSTPPDEGERLQFSETGPICLCELLGEFATVAHCSAPVSVNFALCDVGSSDFARLPDFPTIKRVVLYHTRVSDEDLVHLGALPALKELDLRGTKITDRGLAKLAGLRCLELVRLSGTGVTDSGIAKLKQASPHVQLVR